MKRLPDIKASYDWFFAHYAAETAIRAKDNDIVGIDRMEARRDILERGIFVLMFGQFERAVTAAFEDAVASRINHAD